MTEAGALPVASEDVHLDAADGLPLAATIFVPKGAPRRGVVVINPATSVRRRFYARFASFLAEQGHRVITYDYRGIGDSLTGPIAKSKACMQDWGRLDFAGVLDEAAKHYAGEPIYVVGHSVGGQVVGLASNLERVEGLVLVAAQSGYWGWWPIPARYWMAAMWTLIVPGLTRAFSYLPTARLGAGENLPSGVAFEWARWCRSPEFFVDVRGRPLETRFAQVRVPVLAYSFSDDKFAPPKAVDALVELYTNAQVERRRLTPAAIGVRTVGHFGFFRPAIGGRVWNDVASWLASKQAN
jgi:predicted alpha/beta hydrolase